MAVLPTTSWTREDTLAREGKFDQIDVPFDQIAVPFDQLLSSAATVWTQEAP